MSSIDVKFDGDPEEIGNLSTKLETLSTNITETWASELRSGHSTATDEWTGITSKKFDLTATSAENKLTSLSKDVNTFKKAVDTLKSELDSVNKILKAAISDATTYGLTVEGTTIKEPTKPSCLISMPIIGIPIQVTVTDEEAKQVDDYNKKVKQYNIISDNVSKAREQETKAHNAFQGSCIGMMFPTLASTIMGGDNIKNTLDSAKKVKGNISKYLIDPLKLGGLGMMVAGGQLTKEANKALTDIIYKTKSKLGLKINTRVLMPDKVASGFFEKLKAPFKNGKAMKDLIDPKNWEEVAKKGRHIKDATFSGVKKLHLDKLAKWGSKTSKFVTKAGKVLGPIGTAINVGTVCYDAFKGGADQWSRDSADPSLTTRDKLARAELRGLWDAVPAGSEALGSSAGGALGATLFAWSGPGAVVAGCAGGYAGGKAGKKLGDWIFNTNENKMSKIIDEWKPSKSFLGKKTKSWG